LEKNKNLSVSWKILKEKRLEKMTLEYGSKQMELEVIESKRRKNSFAISIEADGKVMVRVPEGSSREEILSVVKKNRKWILKKQDELEKKKEEKLPFLSETGIGILYQGKIKEMIIRKNNAFVCPTIREGEGKIIIYTAKEENTLLKAALSEWYWKEAKKMIEKRVAYFRPFVKEQIGTIRIKEQKSRWGSCSGKGNLNFNWRLILAPPEVLDYVVAHEMAHLKYMDHSTAFWNHVSELMPDYSQWNNWLKQNGTYLIQYENKRIL